MFELGFQFFASFLLTLNLPRTIEIVMSTIQINTLPCVDYRILNSIYSDV